MQKNHTSKASLLALVTSLALCVGCEREEESPLSREESPESTTAESALKVADPGPTEPPRPSPEPKPAVSSGGGDQVSPATLEVVLQRAGVVHEGSFVKMFGYVRNNSQSWLRDIDLEVQLLGRDGKPLEIGGFLSVVRKGHGVKDAAIYDPATVERAFVPPGEIAPFTYARQTEKIHGTYADQTFRVSATAIPAPDAPRVEIEDFKTEKGEFQYIMTGVIQNVGNVGCKYPDAVVGLYTKDGTLYDVEKSQTKMSYELKTLAPGKQESFTIKKNHFAVGSDKALPPIAEFKVWATCAW